MARRKGWMRGARRMVEQRETHHLVAMGFGRHERAGQSPALLLHGRSARYSALLLSFTAAASTYTSLPICRNFSDIFFMPCLATSGYSAAFSLSERLAA